jgi:hypothetical protein
MKTAQRLLFALLLLCTAASLRAQLPLGPQFRVNDNSTPDLMSPRVAINASGDFVVLWYGFGGSSGGILHARRFKSDGRPATDDIRVADQIVSTNENLELATQDDGSFLVVFSVSGALKVRRFAPDGTLLLDEQVVRDSPYVPQASISARSDGRFVVAWSLFSGEVSARVFSPDGAPLGPVVTADTTGGPKFGPRVAMGPQGDFVVVWLTFLGADPSSGRLLGSFQAQRYGPGSRPRGEKILVSDHYGGSIHVAKDGAGNFLVIWSEVPNAGGGGPHGIQGQRFSAAGALLGTALPLVPSFTTGYTALAMAPDGSFVIAWDSPGQDGFDQNVFAQVFPASGVPRRPAFPVPQRVSGIQRYPWVAINGEGRFVGVWGDGGDLFGRLFKARRP